MDCNACKKALVNKYVMKCRLCLGKFHIECLNIERKRFETFTIEYKSTWVCLMCTNVTQRSRSTDSTPVRAKYINEHAEDLMNMSCDINEPNANISIPSPTSAAGGIASVSSKEAVTMEKIGALFDQKLNTYLVGFMENFRKALRDDVKEMVHHEIKSVVENLKDEFSATTDFICDEQKSMRSDLNKNDERIKYLEGEYSKLQTEIARLNSRLVGIEKISRSCNIELQVVPEHKNENVVAILKKLLDLLKLPMDDEKITACRRVAKINTAFNRPRNIVVSFVTPRVRDTVLPAYHRYAKSRPGRGVTSEDLGISGEARRIFVTEHLSPEQKTLHAATRQTAKERSYKYVWIKYGQVYVRKDDSTGALLIKDINSLNKLK